MSSSEPSFRDLVFSDLARYRADSKPSWAKVMARCLTLPGLLASVLIRAQQCLFRSGHVRSANVVHTACVVLVGADVTPGAVFGRGLYIPHPVGVVIGNSAVLGNHVTLAGGVTIGSRHPDGRGPDGHATIGEGAILSSHAVVLGAITVGENALVAAHSVVSADVPDNAVVAGAPARVVGTRAAIAAEAMK